MKCLRCGNPTNHKSGICIACNFDREFGQDVRLSTPASRPSEVAKSTQGTKGGTLALSPSQNNPYLLDDLQLLILAQVGYIFDLAKEGKLKQAVQRIQLTSEALKNAKN